MPQAKRTPLSADRIVAAAETVAARSGMHGVSMRTVARELGVEAMSLYHHVAGKEQLLDAMAESLMQRIAPPDARAAWQDGLRSYAHSQFTVMRDRPWGLPLLESRRQPGPTVLARHEAVLECLRSDGFGVREAAHAFSIVDSYVRGFVLTLQNLPFEAGDGAAEMLDELDQLAQWAPRLAEVATELTSTGAYDYADGFSDELEAVLSGIGARLAPVMEE